MKRWLARGRHRNPVGEAHRMERALEMDGRVAHSSRKGRFRHFLYLDSQEVLNALSALEEGEIEEVAQTVTRDIGGGLDLQLPIVIGTVSLGGKRRQAIEQALVRKRTVFSAVSKLLASLEDSRDLQFFEEGKPMFSENDLISFGGEVWMWPPGQKYVPIKPSLWSRLWPTEAFFREERESGRLAKIGLPELSTARVTVGPLGFDAVLRLDSHYLVEPRERLKRAVTVVGQVEAMSEQDEPLEVVLYGSGWRPEPPLVGPAAADTSFVEVRGDERLNSKELTAPWAVIRPLCIYK